MLELHGINSAGLQSHLGEIKEKLFQITFLLILSITNQSKQNKIDDGRLKVDGSAKGTFQVKFFRGKCQQVS